ncbi:protein of unknown function [Candidatus Filomicrobium marinum]|nr:protein of unknown function [Candidatus Filomicrobium marinum]
MATTTVTADISRRPRPGVEGLSNTQFAHHQRGDAVTNDAVVLCVGAYPLPPWGVLGALWRAAAHSRGEHCRLKNIPSYGPTKQA